MVKHLVVYRRNYDSRGRQDVAPKPISWTASMLGLEANGRTKAQAAEKLRKLLAEYRCPNCGQSKAKCKCRPSEIAMAASNVKRKL